MRQRVRMDFSSWLFTTGEACMSLCSIAVAREQHGCACNVSQSAVDVSDA